MGRARFPPITGSGRRMKKRRIVRWIGWAAAAAFGWIAFAYLTLPDVRTLVHENPATTAFIELRAHEARAEGKAPRRVQRWVAVQPDLAAPEARGPRRRGRRILEARGVDFDEMEESIEMDWPAVVPGVVRSTITQQLAKNLYLSPSKKPAAQVPRADHRSQARSGAGEVRILESYLNVIEWGDGRYGADAAARSYFGTPAAALGPVSGSASGGCHHESPCAEPPASDGAPPHPSAADPCAMGGVLPPVPATTPTE